MKTHNFEIGDKVRVTNVASHMYGPQNFNEGDVAVVLDNTPLLGLVPGVLVKPTTDNPDPRAIEFGVPFAGEDLMMLTKVE